MNLCMSHLDTHIYVHVHTNIHFHLFIHPLVPFQSPQKQKKGASPQPLYAVTNSDIVVLVSVNAQTNVYSACSEAMHAFMSLCAFTT